MKENDIINFMVSCDNNYARYLMYMLISLLEHSNKNNLYRLYYFNDNLSLDVKKALLALKNTYKNFDIVFKNPKIKIAYDGKYTKLATVRLNIENELPELDKVLYLDADLIVYDDIAKLYKTDISKHAAAVITDYIISEWIDSKNAAFLDNKNISSNWYEYSSKVLGIKRSSDYFNAGVILFNLKRMRSLKLAEQMISFVENTKPPLVDQDALNKFIEKKELKFIKLAWNMNWNFLNSSSDLYRKYLNKVCFAKIAHGHFWSYMCSRVFNAKQQRSFAHYVGCSPLTKIKLIIHGPFETQWWLEISKQIKNFRYKFDAIILVMYKDDVQKYHGVLSSFNLANLHIVTTDIPKNSGFANINRQILQVQKGLCLIDDDDYVFKLRNDQSVDFNKVWNWICDDMIVTTNCYSRKDRPFHPSDMFLFGQGRLLKKYYDISLQQETHNEIVQKNIEICQKNNLNYIPISPESILCKNFLQHFGEDLDSNNSLNILRKYFIILNSWNINYRWLKKRSPFLGSKKIILPHYFSVSPFPGAPVEKAKCYNQSDFLQKNKTLKDIFFIQMSKFLWKLAMKWR